MSPDQVAAAIALLARESVARQDEDALIGRRRALPSYTAWLFTSE